MIYGLKRGRERVGRGFLRNRSFYRRGLFIWRALIDRVPLYSPRRIPDIWGNRIDWFVPAIINSSSNGVCVNQRLRPWFEPTGSCGSKSLAKSKVVATRLNFLYFAEWIFSYETNGSFLLFLWKFGVYLFFLILFLYHSCDWNEGFNFINLCDIF